MLNTLICDIEDDKFDLSNPDDLDDLECQIACAIDKPNVSDMAEFLLFDLGNSHVNLHNVRQRVDDILAVLLHHEEMNEEETWRQLEESMVPTG
ncbi:MAG: hypothetical protein LC104_21825 [Bacteroidales bacterium]|nr:hypothetical protein [Bacteroidales bacterium]